MSDTPASCEVVTVQATSAGKLGSLETEDCSVTDNGAGGVVDVKLIDSRAEEDNGEASDETSSRRESNSSADYGSDPFEAQQTNNEDQDTNNSDSLDNTTQNTPRRKKKKRRSKRKSRSHSSNSLNKLINHDPTNTPQTDTPNEPITTQDTNQDSPTNITLGKDSTQTIQDTTTPEQTTSEDTTTDNTITDDGATKDTDDDILKELTEDNTKDMDTENNPSTPNSPYLSGPSSPSSTTSNDLSHIPQHLLDLTPPPTRGRSNAFYGNKLPPPLLHSHSDGAAIVVQNNSSSLTPRRNTTNSVLGVTVTPTIPEPSHSGLSKPKMFTWRVSKPHCAFLVHTSSHAYFIHS